MRTIVDLPEDHLEELNRLAVTEQRSRAALIREAVAQFLLRVGPSLGDRVAFGIWADRQLDGLEYERRAREQRDS